MVTSPAVTTWVLIAALVGCSRYVDTARVEKVMGAPQVVETRVSYEASEQGGRYAFAQRCEQRQIVEVQTVQRETLRYDTTWGWVSVGATLLVGLGVAGGVWALGDKDCFWDGTCPAPQQKLKDTGLGIGLGTGVATLGLAGLVLYYEFDEVEQDTVKDRTRIEQTAGVDCDQVSTGGDLAQGSVEAVEGDCQSQDFFTPPRGYHYETDYAQPPVSSTINAAFERGREKLIARHCGALQGDRRARCRQHLGATISPWKLRIDRGDVQPMACVMVVMPVSAVETRS